MTRLLRVVAVGGGFVAVAAGLVRGRVQVVPATQRTTAAPPPADGVRVLLGDTAGWGDGAHPSTALCLEWLSSVDLAGRTFWDYGTGSGVLAIAARKLGAAAAVGVDVEQEAVEAAAANAALNGVDDAAAFVHGRGVVPGADAYDVVVANILVGQLSRPSMVATLALGTAPGGSLCLSGFRPGADRAVLRAAYAPYFAIRADECAEAAPDAHGAAYWGTWARDVFVRRDDGDRRALIDAVSDAAVG